MDTNPAHIHSIVGRYTIMLPVLMHDHSYRVSIHYVNARGHEQNTHVYHARPQIALATAQRWIAEQHA